MRPLSKAELSAEFRYRLEERLGILAGDGKPTAGELALAYREPNDWLNQQKADYEQSKETREH